ncbi:MAG TPA: tetratricopeptide repeat-containing sensor histidine kinase [Chryseolinea sp.]|nr:tetratricopeptide repeat-containing sensor histidine kinase [Chryseolinea sp.]
MTSSISSFSQSEMDTVKRNKVLKLLRQDQYKEAYTILSEIEEHYSSLEPDRDYIQLILEISRIFDYKGNYESCLEYALSAYNIVSIRSGFEKEEALALFKIARVYYFINQSEIGLGYAQKELAIGRKLKDDKIVAQALNTIGTLYDKLDDNKAALTYYDSALTLSKKTNDFEGQSITLYYIGIINEKEGRIEQAMEYQLRSLSIDDSLKNMYGVAWSYQILGELFIEMKKDTAAMQYLNKADSLSKALNANGILAEVYQNKKNLFEALGDFKQALHYADLFENLKDSIYNHKFLGSASALQSRYELNLKNLELKEKEITLQHQRTFIIVTSIALLAISVLAFFYYRSFSKVRRLNLEIAHQNEEIRMQSQELSEANSILIELNKAIEEQKEEIQSQSEELTESNQAIYQINQNLEQSIKARTAELVQAYKELDTFFYRASHDFRRPLTTFMGLAEVAKITVKDEYVLSLFDKVKQTATNLDKMLLKLQSISDVGVQHLSVKKIFIKDIFDSVFTTFYESLREEEMKLNVEIAITCDFNSYPSLLNVVIENLVENSIHFKQMGSNSFVNLKAYQHNEEIVIEVSDNGQGIEEQYQDRIFDMYFRGSDRSKGNGLGLYIVKKAVEKLHGRITFQSTYDSGSVFSIFLPKDLV